MAAKHLSNLCFTGLDDKPQLQVKVTQKFHAKDA